MVITICISPKCNPFLKDNKIVLVVGIFNLSFLRSPNYFIVMLLKRQGEGEGAYIIINYVPPFSSIPGGEQWATSQKKMLPLPYCTVSIYTASV